MMAVPTHLVIFAMSSTLSRAERIHAIGANGAKPLAERKVSRLALVASVVFVAAAALAPAESHASNWFSQSISQSSATQYSSNQALRGGVVQVGQIQAIQRVHIKDPPRAGVGTALGGAIGGAMGYSMTRHSSGMTRGLGTLIGTTVGAAGGTMVQNMGSGHDALRIMVRMPDARGRLISRSFVQDDDQRGMYVGATVEVETQGGKQRVVPINGDVANQVNYDSRQVIIEQQQMRGQQPQTRYVRDDGYNNGGTVVISNGPTDPTVVETIIRSPRYRP